MINGTSMEHLTETSLLYSVTYYLDIIFLKPFLYMVLAPQGLIF